MVNPSENPMTNLISLFTFLVTTATLAACGSTISHSPMLDSEPEVGAVLTRAPRTLRLYFEDLPDVDRSALRLVGPNGEHQ